MPPSLGHLSYTGDLVIQSWVDLELVLLDGGWGGGEGCFPHASGRGRGEPSPKAILNELSLAGIQGALFLFF